MLAWLKRAFGALRSTSPPARREGRLEQVRALQIDQDDQPLLHLLHVSLREGADEAADLARRRLVEHYESVGDKHKRLAILMQLADQHPQDGGLAAALEAAHLALGHPASSSDAAPPRRAEVVKLAREDPTWPDAPEDPTAPMPAIDGADTDVDAPPRAVKVPDDPTAQVDPKMLDVLRQLSR